MAKGFYFRLAKTNLLRNKVLYLPYSVAVVILSAMFFIILNIVFSESISNMNFGGTTQALLRIGLVIMGIFTFGYMLYINSFLVKRRKKEFGLYGVLGLEKRHVGRVVLWENSLLNLSALAVGLLAGTVLGQLMFQLLLLLVKSAPGSVFDYSLSAYVVTVLYFGAVFLVATLYNQMQVRLANPVDLLAGPKRAEKRVRLVIPMTLLGCLCLGAAYWYSITVEETGAAMLGFWPAVLLVIGATWALFTAGSVFVLGRLRKNKNFYYRPGNFIAVAGLSHRLKQNAAGLANICILSTMVMITVGGCCALYFGQEAILHERYPDGIYIAGARADSYSLFGGFLFMGVLFALLFLVNTVLIIYFKQLSEGLEDRERFVILRQVGLSDAEVKRTIDRQVLVVFFLPLLFALCHVAAAGNLMVRCMEAFHLYEADITLLCLGITGLAFSLVYLCVYKATARVYYRLLQ